MHLQQLSTGLTVALSLFGQASSHFLLNYPNSLGFDDEKEDEGPCGSFNVTFDNATDFHVNGDAIALTSTHPEADWLFRATLDKTGMGNNWTDLLPVVHQQGLGQYCEPSLTVPANWAGQSGVVQVIQHGDDGSLYQCAAINFVEGKATAPPPNCKNATGLSAAFTTDASLATAATATAGPSGSMSMSGATATGAAPAPASSAASSDAVLMHQHAAGSSLVWSIMAASGLAAFVLGLSCI